MSIADYCEPRRYSVPIVAGSSSEDYQVFVAVAVVWLNFLPAFQPDGSAELYECVSTQTVARCLRAVRICSSPSPIRVASGVPWASLSASRAVFRRR